MSMAKEIGGNDATTNTKKNILLTWGPFKVYPDCYIKHNIPTD